MDVWRRRDIHVESSRCLIGIEELSESSFVLVLIESRLVISVIGSIISLELGDVDIVDEIRDLLKVRTSRI